MYMVGIHTLEKHELTMLKRTIDVGLINASIVRQADIYILIVRVNYLYYNNYKPFLFSLKRTYPRQMHNFFFF